MSEPEEITTMSGQKLPLKMSVDYISFSAHTDYQQTSEFIRALKPPHVVSLCVWFSALVGGKASKRADTAFPCGSPVGRASTCAGTSLSHSPWSKASYALNSLICPDLLPRLPPPPPSVLSVPLPCHPGRGLCSGAPPLTFAQALSMLPNLSLPRL